MQDGPAVRLGFALMAPVVPLLVISSCLIFEIFSTGSGITAMLKAWNFSDLFFSWNQDILAKTALQSKKNVPATFSKYPWGEKQRICGWLSDFKLKRLSSLFLFRTWKLQAITILYIGGASSTSSLLTCQELDGNQDASATFWCNLMFFFRFGLCLTFGFSSLVRVLLPNSAWRSAMSGDWPFTKCKHNQP